MVGRSVARVSAAAVVAACLGGGTAHAASGVQALEVLSNRADLISGGDALVAARLAAGLDPATVRVDVDGIDVTSAFALRPSGRLEGLVTGLKVGANTLTVRDAGGAGKRITITNHPIGGPLFAGPQVTPYACNPNASNPPLGAAVDAQCNAPTRVDYLYRNTRQPVRGLRPGEPARARAHPADDDRPRADRAVHRPARHRHRRPRHLPDGRPGGPEQADRAVVGRAAVEPASSSTRSAAPAGPSTASSPRAACCRRSQLGAGFVGRDLEPEHLRQQLQRRGQRRGDDDDQGDRHRALRAVEVHDGQRRLGGLDAAAPARRELPGPARRPHDQPGLRGPLDAGAGLARLPRADALLLADEPADEPRPRVRAGQRAVPDGRRAAARVGLEPDQPGQPVRPEGAGVRRRPHRARARPERRLRTAARAGLEPGDESHGRALRDRRLHARDLRRHGHARRAERQGQAGGRQRRRPVRPACAAERADHARAVRRPQPQGRRDGHRRQLRRPSAQSADPDALRIAYETGRVNSATGAAKLPEIDNRTGAQMDDTGFHPAFHSFSYRARLDRSNGNHDNQVIWLLAHRRRRAEPVRRHAPVAGQRVPSPPRPRTPASWPTACRAISPATARGSTTAPRASRPAPRSRSTSSSASSSRSVRGDYAVTFTDEQWATLQTTFPTGVCDYASPA